MNLVKQIMDSLSGEALGKLGSLLGTDTETASNATSAAVPSLLSALSGLASTEGGAKKLTNVLGGIDTSSIGNLASMLGGDTPSLLSKGTGMLGSLFGEGILSNLAGAISRFSGLNSNMVRTLLGYLSPLVLGKLASSWKQQGGTTQALTSMFANQRENIADALPAGLSLADIPGPADYSRTTTTTTRRATAEPVAAASPAKWLLPVAALLLGAFLLWRFFPRGEEEVVADRNTPDREEVMAMRPTLPENFDVTNVAQVRDEFGSLFRSLNTTFTDIDNPAAAERALPELRDLNTKIDSMNQVVGRLPEASMTALRPMFEEQVKAVTEKANEVSSMSGIGAEIKNLIGQIVEKITKWISS